MTWQWCVVIVSIIWAMVAMWIGFLISVAINAKGSLNGRT